MLQSVIRSLRRFSLDTNISSIHQTLIKPIQDAPVRVRITLKEMELEEKFIRGWGKGGQKVNKTNNCVCLKHLPTGITVKCHDQRLLTDNRRIARQMMIDKLDQHINGDQSKAAMKQKKQQARKRTRAKRAKVKYGNEANEVHNESTVGDNTVTLSRESTPNLNISATDKITTPVEEPPLKAAAKKRQRLEAKEKKEATKAAIKAAKRQEWLNNNSL